MGFWYVEANFGGSPTYWLVDLLMSEAFLGRCGKDIIMFLSETRGE